MIKFQHFNENIVIFPENVDIFQNVVIFLKTWTANDGPLFIFAADNKYL